MSSVSTTPTTTATENAKNVISQLLTTAHSPGSYCAGGDIPAAYGVPKIKLVSTGEEQQDEDSFSPLEFPLSDSDVCRIKAKAELAEIGLVDRDVVDLNVRKTWQIKPHGLSVTSVEPALEHALAAVARDLGTATDYQIQAHLYKLLLYEEGCFFARHRDNERLDGMFATLILELPSSYEGAELSVWSPLTPHEKKTFFGSENNNTALSAGNIKRRRSARLSKPKMKFAAFYADCHHEVSELLDGHRAVLVYHLTAQSILPRPRQFNHLPAPSPSPPQPAFEGIVLRIAGEMDRFVKEPNTAYPCDYGWGSETGGEEKPVKFVLVLSHHYTPVALSTGMAALKGSDRGIGELIRGAAWIRPDGDHQGRRNSLQRLAANALLEQNPSNYQALPSNHAVHECIKDEYEGDFSATGSANEGPYIDAYLALATLYDRGEMTAYDDNYGFRTTGQLISLTNPGSQPLFDMGPALQNDLEPEYHPSWFGEDGEEDSYEFDRAPAGNHSLPLYNHELLFASAQAMELHLSQQNSATCQNEAKSVEFLGNGMPYPGRVYSRAVIVMWPRAHRTSAQEQTKGGSMVLGNSKPSAQE